MRNASECNRCRGAPGPSVPGPPGVGERLSLAAVPRHRVTRITDGAAASPYHLRQEGEEMTKAKRAAVAAAGSVEERKIMAEVRERLNLRAAFLRNKAWAKALGK